MKPYNILYMRDLDSKIYYELRVVIPSTWSNGLYTYSSDDEMVAGAVVLVPFGSSEKLAVVRRKVEKPSFDTKDISTVTDLVLSPETITLHEWISNYYPATPGSTTQLFLPSMLKKKQKKNDKDTDNNPEFVEKISTKLTITQKKALSEIAESAKPIVLHGVTGSGKTRIYAELALEQIKQGKDVLILYPEISLTTQTKNALELYLGKRTTNTYHSKQSTKKQYASWMQANEGTGKVFIGPRSALFLPYKNLGLVIIDEAHDSSYKQDSGTRYSAIAVGAKLASIHDAKFILGSATPPVIETQQILSKGGRMVCMHETAIDGTEHGKTLHRVVDMTNKKLFRKSYNISDETIETIQKSLALGNQSLLFLNRRGTARLLYCDNCAWHAECPNCERPYTYHQDTHQLICHLCGSKSQTPQLCPDCNHEISLKTLGTKGIEIEIQKIFPTAKIGRYDSDNLKKDSLAEKYKEIVKGDIDILLGTQLLTKGLDLPKLDVVAILNADSSLSMPDYSSEERAFQQLTQVSGRVGRGHRAGTVVLQTYQPENPIFNYVSAQDWHKFYDDELLNREKYNYPPYSYSVKIWCAKPNRQKAKESIEQYVDSISVKGLRFLGPAPSYYEKNAGKYSWQVVMLSHSRIKLIELVKELPNDFYFDMDPISLL